MEALSNQTSWEVYPQLSKAQFQAARTAGVEPVLAQLLANRGLTNPEIMHAFLHASYNATPDPLTLIDMPRALARIKQALAEREHITVYGDYDADGVTSSSLLFRALRSLKHPDALLDFHIPHRLRDGCGLNLPALDQLKANGTSLIITTDCASSDVSQVEHARMLGIDVIITDHHHPPATLPEAYAMVNPWRPDCSYGERYLCGVGIAFKLTQALYRAFQRPQEDEMALLDLVAVGTIADIAPLLGENHTLVRLGMQRLNATQNPGLRALMQIANLQPGRIRERDIAFGLAPRINAAGRMQEASIAFRLLTTDLEEEARALASKLEQLNLLRQRQTEELMQHVREQARLQPAHAIVLVSGNDWHEGIIGLVAGKLTEEVKKPVLVLSNDPQTKLSRGSARGPRDFNIIAALRGFDQHLERYGGHAQAAGFTIKSESIPQLHDHLLRWQANGEVPPPLIPGTDLAGVVTEQETIDNATPQPSNIVDLTFTRFDRITLALYKELRQISPFGAGNPEPVFKMERLRLLDTWNSGANRQHLRLRLAASEGTQNQMGTLIRGANMQQQLKNVTHVDIIFRLESFERGPDDTLNLRILDVWPSQ